jgi:hypothetical protein
MVCTYKRVAKANKNHSALRPEKNLSKELLGPCKNLLLVVSFEEGVGDGLINFFFLAINKCRNINHCLETAILN